MIIFAVITVALFLGIILVLALKIREIGPQPREVILYFPDKESRYLIGEKRVIDFSGDPAKRCRLVIKELIIGSIEGLIPTIPYDTELIGAEVDEAGVASINFSSEFQENHEGGSTGEMMTVYSVVNSLTRNVPDVKMVQFLVEGKEIKSLTGHLNLYYPVGPKTDLIRK
jgi:germination protein M